MGVRELEHRDAEQQLVVTQQQDSIAHQAAVIAQQQEAIASYQEQLAKAAEQLRFFKRAMFGQRRERDAPSPDQKVLFVPEVVEGLDAKQETTQDTTADSLPPRTRRKPRRPRIEFPQFWEHRRTKYPLPPDELLCGCCGAQRIIIRTHVTKRLEMEEAKLYVIEEVRFWPGHPPNAARSCRKHEFPHLEYRHSGSRMLARERTPFRDS